jgi:hypothetical protein
MPDPTFERFAWDELQHVVELMDAKGYGPALKIVYTDFGTRQITIMARGEGWVQRWDEDTEVWGATPIFEFDSLEELRLWMRGQV